NRRSVLGGLAAACVAPSVHAGEWPEKAIVWVVPFPAGGPTDTFTRPLAEEVGKRLGQTIVIDNRSGAGGTIGAAVVARAAADGYTMLVGYTGFTYAPLVYANAGFDLLRDFAPISAIDRVQEVLVVNPSRLDVLTLRQFLDIARRKPGSIDIASGGLGTVPHHDGPQGMLSGYLRAAMLISHDNSLNFPCPQPLPTPGIVFALF